MDNDDQLEVYLLLHDFWDATHQFGDSCGAEFARNLGRKWYPPQPYKNTLKFVYFRRDLGRENYGLTSQEAYTFIQKYHYGK
jgi:hypothetical protein